MKKKAIRPRIFYFFTRHRYIGTKTKVTSPRPILTKLPPIQDDIVLRCEKLLPRADSTTAHTKILIFITVTAVAGYAIPTSYRIVL